MSESERRHTRFVLPMGEFSRQRVKGRGMFASLRGWKDCRVKDMSSAGALLLTTAEHNLGDFVDLELTATAGSKLVFRGEVVNLGKDHATAQNKVGIKLDHLKTGSNEANFLASLQARYAQNA
ncbi:PilZ domain-containing protein [Pseudomonas syringae pv. actinidiae]|nr:PilZ domain-containing protein [Pseudomonas syringae pv. actinidiae]